MMTYLWKYWSEENGRDEWKEVSERTAEFKRAEAMLIEAGYRVSAASHEGERNVYLFSVESYGSNAYGHSKATISFDRVTRWWSVSMPGNNKSWKEDEQPARTPYDRAREIINQK